MNSAKQILGFATPNESFVLAAKHLLSPFQKEKIKQCSDRMFVMASELGKFEEDMPSEDVIEKAYYKFNRYSLGSQVFLTGKELKYVTYAMERITQLSRMKVLLALLDERWKSSFIGGLFLYLLTNWDSYNQEIVSEVRNLFLRKIALYSGKRDKYLIIQANAQFLQEKGAETLGTYLRRKKHPLTSVCQEIFGMNSNHIEYEYFSKVIVAYFEKITEESLQDMETILHEHNNPITAKRLIPNMIVEREEGMNNLSTSILKSLAIRYIGDPSIKAQWSLPAGSEEERGVLDDARVILNNWLKKEFISIFFEKCVNEPDRKSYWLDRTNLILDFKIYTTRFVYDMILSRDETLKDCLKTNVVVLRMESYDKHAALVLDMGKYLLVEFSDVGAIYIYKKGGMYARNIEIGNITYLRELKKTNLGYLNATNLSPFHDEGKMIHNGGWEKKMDSWFEHYGII